MKKKPSIYSPSDPAHRVIAKAARSVGVDKKWDKLVAYVDTCLVGEIEDIIPVYCKSLPKGERPFLTKAVKNCGIKKRIQKIIRDVRAGIRIEQASQQP